MTDYLLINELTNKKINFFYKFRNNDCVNLNFETDHIFGGSFRFLSEPDKLYILDIISKFSKLEYLNLRKNNI